MQVKNLPSITARLSCPQPPSRPYPRPLAFGGVVLCHPLGGEARQAGNGSLLLACGHRNSDSSDKSRRPRHPRLQTRLWARRIRTYRALYRHSAYRSRARRIKQRTRRITRAAAVEFACYGRYILGCPANGGRSWHRKRRFRGPRSWARRWINHPRCDLWHRPARRGAVGGDDESLVLGEHCRRARRRHHNGRPCGEASGAVP